VRVHELVTSHFILDELQQSLVKKLDVSTSKAREAVVLLQSQMEVVEPIALNKPVCRDSDDDFVLGTAISGNCQCIVTGDKDLLHLKRYRQIEIVSPSQFW